MKKYSVISIVALIFINFACSKEYELKKSIFIEDPEYPGLPRYSESGYNTFGAYYDRQTFVSSDVVPIKVESTEGRTTFIFSGRKDYNEMSLSIELSDLHTQDYSDLLFLSGKTLDLTDSKYAVKLIANGSESAAKIISGTFVINKVRKIIVDTKDIQLVLSGTFAFQSIINGEPISLSDGRFDVSVYEENFFVY